ncbi:MAG: phage tail sheath subtilisin-like domain-containing protein [Clostridiaceae bacterium]
MKSAGILTTTIILLLFALLPYPSNMAESEDAAVRPGIYTEENPADVPSITPVDTAVAGFLGQTEKGPLEPQFITSYEEYEEIYGGNPGNRFYLPDEVKGYFENGGTQLYVARVVAKKAQLSNARLANYVKNVPTPILSDYIGNGNEDLGTLTGLQALGLIDEITILYSPEAHSIFGLYQAMIDQCENLGDRIVIMESPLYEMQPEPLERYESSFAVYYSPWLKISQTSGGNRLVPPGGFIAGTYAKADTERGVHKVPAAIELIGVTGLERAIGKTEQNDLLWNRVNPIIQMPGRGIMAYGARTLTTDPEYTYVNVRRYLNYIDESISESLEYLAFESWSPTLNSKIQSGIEDFLLEEWRNGALLGSRQNQAYYVNAYPGPVSQGGSAGHAICIEVGVALIRPAEFHIVRTSIIVE